MATAADHAYVSLRRSILAGEFEFGSRLGEVDLADALDISRTPVREALRRLSSEGIVEVSPHRGARVPEWTPTDLDDVYELRSLLESYGAARAAERIRADQLEYLDSMCTEMERLAATGPDRDLDRLADVNAEFHAAILDAAGNYRLVSLMAAVVQVPLVLRTFHRYSEEALARSQNHHRELAAALGAGDSEWAASIMRSHILAARRTLLRGRQNAMSEE
jgi:DNA-binding GntR family transcriptional regulator